MSTNSSRNLVLVSLVMALALAALWLFARSAPAPIDGTQAAANTTAAATNDASATPSGVSTYGTPQITDDGAAARGAAGTARLSVTVVPAAEPWGPFSVRVRCADGRVVEAAAEPRVAHFAELVPGAASVHVERLGWRGADTDVELRAGDNALDVRLDPLVRVFGQAFEQESSAPLASFRVRLEARVRGSQGEYVVVSLGGEVANERGEFAFAEETLGVLAERVRISAKGFVPLSSAWIDVAGDAVPIPPLGLVRSNDCSVAGAVRARGGGALASARVTFVPGSAAPAIHVTDDGPHPVPAQPLSAVEQGLVDEHGAPTVEEAAGADGHFEFGVPCEARGRLVAWAPGASVWTSDGDTGRNLAARTWSIVLDAAPTLTVHVLQGAHSRRTTDVENVFVRGANGSVAGVRKGAIDGDPYVVEFECHGHAGAGQLEVWGKRRGAPPERSAPVLLASRDFDPAADASEVTVHVATGLTGARVLATLVLPDGILRDSTLARLRPSSGTARAGAPAFLDAEGRVEFTDLAPGDYELAIFGDGAAAQRALVHYQTLSLAADARVDLGTLDLGASGRLRLVTQQPGYLGVWSITPAAPSDVATRSVPELFVRPEPDGNVLIYGLPPGAYSARRVDGGAVLDFVRSAGGGNEDALGVPR